MSQSLHANYAHIIFSTKGREPTITKDIAPQIYSYLSGIVQKSGAVPIRINGMPDHVHLLVKTSKTSSDAQFMKELKGGSSKWINQEGLTKELFKWQAGYGWFSVSPKDTDLVNAYIENQAEHHQVITFQDELRKFLTTYQIEYDERYLWG